MKQPKRKKKYVYMDAKSGHFVSRLYALLHPFTTMKVSTKENIK